MVTLREIASSINMNTMCMREVQKPNVSGSPSDRT